MSDAPVMVADLGGTSLRVALEHKGELRGIAHARAEDLGTDAAPWLRAWMQAQPVRAQAATVAVAGPVADDEVRLTNSPIGLRAADLGLPARLVNDLHAAAMGVDRVPPELVRDLGGPALQPGGVIAVLGLGTGLGEALRLGNTVLPGEGGHASFAPADAQQARLLAFLAARNDGYVDWEHAASGRAMGPVLDFALTEVAAPAWLRQVRAALPEHELGPLVLGHPGEPACALARELVLSTLGREAGNMALRHLATGGLWLVGGLAAKLSPWLPGGAFHDAFETRGRFSELARRMPRRLVLDDLVGLRGAAVIARVLLEQR